MTPFLKIFCKEIHFFQTIIFGFCDSFQGCNLHCEILLKRSKRTHTNQEELNILTYSWPHTSSHHWDVLELQVEASIELSCTRKPIGKWMCHSSHRVMKVYGGSTISLLTVGVSLPNQPSNFDKPEEKGSSGTSPDNPLS